MNDPTLFDALDPGRMCRKAASIMEGKANKPHAKAFPLAVMAGLFIGLGFVYCAMANVSGAGKIVGGLVFSLGLMLVIILGADLFTSSTLTLIAGAGGKASWKRIFANWAVVYAGNFLGALLLVGIVLMSGHPWESGGQIALHYIGTTGNKLSHTFAEAVGLGILCNLMVCLGVWMSYSGRSVIDKMAACLFPVGLFISCGFEHSVANMYMIPIGILCHQMAPAEMAAALSAHPHLGELLTWGNFFTKNLVPVTIGNILGGGVLVGMWNWFIYLRPEEKNQKKPQGTPVA